MAGNNKRQLSKRSIAYAALGIFLISLMTLIGTSAFLRVVEINVEGVVRYSVEEIVEASGLSPGNNLLFVNTQNISQQIRDELPFVNEARVTRNLPDTVQIEIIESREIAIVRHAGTDYIINSAGRVVASTADGNGDAAFIFDNDGNRINLIEVRGVDIEAAAVGSLLRPVFGSDLKLQYMRDILYELERAGLEHNVSYLDVSNIVNVHFEYLGMYRVLLGGAANLRQSNLRHNIENLPGMIQQIQNDMPNTPGELDLTDPNRGPHFRD